MFVAYRGFSVILFAPVAAMLAMLLTDPAAVPTVFTGLFMDKMVGFVKLYFPVFLLSAVFGKVIELSGFSKSIVSSVIDLVGRERAMLSIVLVGAILTYGGVSLFVGCSRYIRSRPRCFARAISRAVDPGHDRTRGLPGTPRIQNIIPRAFFETTTWAAPWLGVIGATFILIAGLLYLNWRRRQAASRGEGYGTGHTQEPEVVTSTGLANPVLAILPLIVVGVMNKVFTAVIPRVYGVTNEISLVGLDHPVVTQVPAVVSIWAVEGALLLGILARCSCSPSAQSPAASPRVPGGRWPARCWPP